MARRADSSFGLLSDFDLRISDITSHPKQISKCPKKFVSNWFQRPFIE